MTLDLEQWFDSTKEYTYAEIKERLQSEIDKLQAQADLAAGLQSELAERRLQDPLLGQGYSTSANGMPTQGDGEGTENIYQSHVDRAELIKAKDLAAGLRAALEKIAKLSNIHKPSRTALHYAGLARDALNPQPHHEEAPTPADLAEDGKPVTDADANRPLIGPQPWKHGGA